MRIAFKKRVHGQIEFGVIYGGIALLLLVAAKFLPFLSFAPACVFRELTHIPCPTCGSTRAGTHLLHGEFFAALTLNPLFTLGLFALLLYFAYCIVTLAFDLPRIVLILTDGDRKLVRAVVLFLITAQWIYLIYRN
jgi:hypothetical protein